MKRGARILLIALLMGAFVFASQGCSSSGPSSALTLPDPVIAPPSIKEAGKLYVGVDYQYLPFSADVDGKMTGLDVEVASMIAEDMGLKVEFVDVSHDEAALAFEEKRIDIMMSMVLGDIDPGTIAVTGIYAQEAPALFTTKEKTGTFNKDNLTGVRVGAQSDTMASWEVSNKGATNVVEYDDLTRAFEALKDGSIDVVACDAIVGAYLCSLYPDTQFEVQLKAADLVGVGVDAKNAELQKKVQEALDKAKSDGRLDFLKAHWLGDLPELSFDTTGTPVNSQETTVTP